MRLELRERVPQGHKVALADIATDAAIRRYGEVIGYAMAPIARGSWVEESKVRMPAAPALDGLELATRVPAPLPPLEGYTFEGFRNQDGSVGTKNLLAISTSVQCVAGTLDVALKRIKDELLPRFPNVDDVVALNHTYGCGVAISAPQAVVPIRTLQSLARHPNFGGEVLIVGLGCEKLQPERLMPEGRTDDILRLQDEAFHGFGAMVDGIMAMAEARLEILNRRRRETCPASDLVVGLQCGGSDAFSGVTANPAVGFAADLLVRAGATVMFSEVTEVRDAIHLLTPRAATPGGRARADPRDGLVRRLSRAGRGRPQRQHDPRQQKGWARQHRREGARFDDQVRLERNLGRAGARRTCEPERADLRGHAGERFVCGTLQLASGMTMQVFTTGRGTPYGLAAAPVIKVSTRSELAERWNDLIDLDAGRIATGAATIEQVGWELFRLMLDVASGRTKPWSDRWGLYNALALFNPAPVT